MVVISVAKNNKHQILYAIKSKDCSVYNQISILLNSAISKTRNEGTGNRLRRMQGTRGMFTRIPENVLEDSGEYSHFIIPRNARNNSGECSRTFQEMFKYIPGNVREDPGEYSGGFRGMFKKILGNAIRDSGEYYQRYRELSKRIPDSV